jgi:hypothetical protein
MATRLRRREIQEDHELLLALADRLRDGEPLGVQGLAMTARPVNDRFSHPYRSGASGALPAAVTEASPRSGAATGPPATTDSGIPSSRPRTRRNR